MIEVRMARPEDLPRICELERECFSLPWTLEQLAGQLTGDGKLLLTAEDGGVIAGYMGLDWVLDEGYVTNVCTAPEFRRRGVGGALVAAVIARAESLDLSFVTLEARVSNLPAIRLYEKYGFEAVGVRPGYYEKPREDALIMTLYLKKEGAQ